MGRLVQPLTSLDRRAPPLASPGLRAPAPPPGPPVGRLEADPVFRDLFFDSPQPMWLVDAGTLGFLEANAAVIRMYGYSRREFLEMTLGDLEAPGSAGRTHPGQVVASPFGAARHRTRSGTELVVDLRSWLLPPSGVRLVMVDDATARQHAVLHLHRHWQHLAALLGGGAYRRIL